MTIDATFWVAVSFFIFLGVLIYLKVPQKINSSLNEKIREIKNELDEAEKIKEDAKKLLNDYENKITNAQRDSHNIIETAKKESEKIIINNTEKFHQLMDAKKKAVEQKISQMKINALKDIKNISVRITFEVVENLIKNSIDKSKLDSLYNKNLEQTKISLKKIKV